MSLTLAQANAWSLATSMMVCVVLFVTADGTFGVMIASEFDGDPASVMHEYDPFEL